MSYLEYKLRDGQRWLMDALKETIIRILEPQNICQVREFLGSAGFCRLWIPGFADIARPLYEATKQRQDFVWTEAMNKTFNDLKQALLSAPALGLRK